MNVILKRGRNARADHPKSVTNIAAEAINYPHDSLNSQRKLPV